MAELVKNIENALKSSPFNDEQKELISKLVASVSVEQVYWLGGFLTGLNTTKLKGNTWGEEVENTEKANNNQLKQSTPVKKPEITILYGSRTGNGEEIAESARRIALGKGFNPVLKDMSKYNPNNLKDESNLIVIVSTHGDGVPPLEAEDLHHFLHNGSATNLSSLNFSVCALGDSSYQKFCQTGKDFDNILEKLGGKRIYNRAECDVDYEDVSEDWINKVLSAFADIAKPVEVSDDVMNIPEVKKVSYSKKSPFQAALKNKVLLNGRGSDKETYHIELSLEGSGLEYEVGDALGVYSINDDRLVNKIINHLELNPFEKVETYDGTKELNEALVQMYELSIISSEVLKKYAKLSPNKELEEIIDDKQKLEKYLYGRDILDLVTDYPVSGITANEFVKVLRKLPARLYSIASSSKLHPGEVHITVSAVRFELNSRERYGVCSTFLADKVGPDVKVPVYVEKNKAFRLPEDPETPVIMVGPGTGIAPFRAFIEERSLNGSKKNWLFFGDQHFTTDFLYQLELQRYMKKNVLERLDVAFSRDEKEKVYVQHRMLENSKNLFDWIKDGAHFYVCGDEKHMAKDVHNTLIEIVKTEGKMSLEKAEEYVKNMQKSRRYQEDVY